MMKNKEKIQERVLQWYTKNGRKLPWRETTDPYKILVSEIMLQQTQVDRVIPKYYAFLERFHTAEALAQAFAADVLRLWSGLGYNRRALYLQQCAKALVEKYNGIFPTTEAALLELPGIGKYTAAAVLSFAFNKDVPVIDVNIALLYKRIFYNKAENIEGIAQEFLPKNRSRDWHNALMDIGALFCTATNPKCNACPVKQFCASANKPERHEATRQKKKVVPFKKSDRIVRGTILKLLTQKNKQTRENIYAQLLEQKIKRKKEKFDEIVADLEKEGLLKKEGKRLSLP